MRTVWVVHDKGHDLSDASRFGDVRTLVRGQVNVFDISSRLLEIRDGLQSAKEDDYLLLSGYALLNVIASGILMERFGGLNLLVFNGISRDYSVRTLSRNQLLGKEAVHAGDAQ